MLHHMDELSRQHMRERLEEAAAHRALVPQRRASRARTLRQLAAGVYALLRRT